VAQACRASFPKRGSGGAPRGPTRHVLLAPIPGRLFSKESPMSLASPAEMKMGGYSRYRLCRPLRGWNRVGSSSRAHALDCGTSAPDGASPVKPFNKESQFTLAFSKESPYA